MSSDPLIYHPIQYSFNSEIFSLRPEWNSETGIIRQIGYMGTLFITLTLFSNAQRWRGSWNFKKVSNWMRYKHSAKLYWPSIKNCTPSQVLEVEKMNSVCSLHSVSSIWVNKILSSIQCWLNRLTKRNLLCLFLSHLFPIKFSFLNVPNTYSIKFTIVVI